MTQIQMIDLLPFLDQYIAMTGAVPPPPKEGEVDVVNYIPRLIHVTLDGGLSDLELSAEELALAMGASIGFEMHKLCRMEGAVQLSNDRLQHMTLLVASAFVKTYWGECSEAAERQARDILKKATEKQNG